MGDAEVRRRRWTRALFAVAASVGTVAGLGLYTFTYAAGASYLKTDPAACANCHIMQSQYDSWQKSSHHTTAVCVDCHLPEPFLAKYLAKAENGWRHGKLFTTQTFKEPIEVAPAGRAILQANCLRCHGELVADTVPPSGHGADRSLRCVQCHPSVGHGDRAALGPPLSKTHFPLPTDDVAKGTP